MEEECSDCGSDEEEEEDPDDASGWLHEIELGDDSDDELEVDVFDVAAQHELKMLPEDPSTATDIGKRVFLTWSLNAEQLDKR